MKNITLLLLSLTTSMGFSQITYNSSNFASINDSFLVSHATAALTGLNFTTAGSNMTWDYSALTPNTQETILWVNPTSTGYKTSWCFSNNYFLNCNTQFNNSFNLATKAVDGLVIQGFGVTNAYMHSKLTTANFSNKMIGANITVTGLTIPFTVSYTQPDVLYQFPMNYNDTYNNLSNLSFDLTSLGVPLVYTSAGQRTNVVEGWGSLITPFGTFTNVLKMKSTLVEDITVVIQGQSTPTTQTTISYKWFDLAYGIPVLEVTGQEIAGLWTPTNTTYIDIQRCLDPTALFAYFPITPDFDPITQTASVSFINGSTNFDVSDWDFGDGSTHSSVKNPTHNFTCPGVKQVTLTVTNQFCDPDKVDTITLPITITDTQNAFATTVTVDAVSLTADRTLAGTTYQWLDCDNANTPIDGATSQVLTPIADGNFAVQLTTNGCTSVSDCYSFTTLSNSNFNGNSATRLFPNPTKGKLELLNSNIQITKVSVFNILGMLVGNSLDLTANTSGIYMIKLYTNQGIYTQKVIKE